MALAIRYICHQHPELGWIIFAKNTTAICFLSFGKTPAVLIAQLQKRFPTASCAEQPELQAELTNILTSPKPEASLAFTGTPFQQEVWQALLTIPKGEVRSYQDIATQIKRPKAVRAVGSALGANPIAWLIPCHRVISKNKGIGGFSCGLATKKALLAMEGVFF